jgi:KTSC domain-containing protein
MLSETTTGDDHRDRSDQAGEQSPGGGMNKLIIVESSMIHAVGYDSGTKILEVVFNSGRTYCYEGVPLKVYKELMAADSKGRYMRSEIVGAYPDYPISGRRRR